MGISSDELPSMDPLSNKITSVEASKRFGITNDYVTQLCRKGKIDGTLWGRVWYINADSLDTYLQEVRRRDGLRRSLLSSQFKKEYEPQTQSSQLARAAPLVREVPPDPKDPFARVPRRRYVAALSLWQR